MYCLFLAWREIGIGVVAYDNKITYLFHIGVKAKVTACNSLARHGVRFHLDAKWQNCEIANMLASLQGN